MNLDNIMLATEHFAGLLVVMLALVSLWILTATMSWLVARLAPATAVPAPPSTGRVADIVAEDDDEVAVIAATVAVLLGPTSRVIAVQQVSTAWADQGRRDIHISHRLP
jgi:Na+-transporting methylmalonyl-CoA/oxaloacetate decarboxylase gamma subunit